MPQSQYEEEDATIKELYKYNSLEYCAEKILLDTLAELGYSKNKQVSLVRFFLKMRSLMRLVNKERTREK